MARKVISSFFFLILIACVVFESDRSPAQTTLVLVHKNWVYPNQPCPDDKCAVAINPHDKDTDFICQECEYNYYEKGLTSCPDDMVEIEGEYCPTVKQRCLHWRNDKEGERCEEWSTRVTCESKMMVDKHYCIDRYEYPNKQGQIPQDWMSWNDVKSACESEGKRLCTRSEWTFAAEGPNQHPYPYGDGYHRDNTICNFDNHVASIGITGDDVMTVADPNSEVAQKLRSLLVPSDGMPGCVSDWGVHDMSGNIDEWIQNEGNGLSKDKAPYYSGLMGGHVFGVRNASRPVTDAHAAWFRWYETGGRCCKDAR